jgi:DNA-binding GntR family transcriptional regulator
VTQRTTPWGAYKRIADALRARIESGEFPPGAPLPSETALCAQYEVARGTVRRALAELNADGLVDARPGRGRVVHDRASSDVQVLPRYRAIANDLRALIDSGELKAGDLLPSESALTERYGVARGTVRQALAELRGAGLVEAVHGRGQYVRPT